MKRLFSCILAILLVLSLFGVAFSESESQAEKSKSWPELTIDWSDTALRGLGDNSSRHQAYHGPDKKYAQAGAFKPGKVNSARSLFSDGDYVLVDLDYPTVGRRCVYFKKSMLSSVPEEQVVLESHPARTDVAIIPVMGPGEEYDRFTQTKPPEWVYNPDDWPIEDWIEWYGEDDPQMFELWALVSKYGGSYEIAEATDEDVFIVTLSPGTEINVFFETNGWAYAEFTCGIGLVRAWLPARFISAV